ncbi:hypothetical protein ILYODFUR_026119 [Ilyodon furcidens]|uniref:Uncharacterized protein n=1 Tax=Ilyodon furcidens TaxID=33524 RepID=A0ABV0UWM3_9TELE
MMAPDPMRSATDIGGTEDTSLAMPSDRSLCTGHQRVLNQVHSIKRGRSKYNKNGTTSPTSPPTQTFKTYEFGTSKFKGASTYRRSNSTMSAANRAVIVSLSVSASCVRNQRTDFCPFHRFYNNKKTKTITDLVTVAKF